MKSIFKTTVLIITLLVSCNIWAWGTTGHRIVAEIAEKNLSRKAKKEIKKIIGDQKLAYWANWPDFIKSDSQWKFADSWHYVNIPGDLSYDAFLKELDNSSEDNLYKRALILMEELKKKELPLEKKQQYLYFLIHIIGDAHQPLHVGREEDLGGNKVTLEWFGSKTNLHTIWDSKLIDFEKYSYTEYADVLNRVSKKEIKEIQKGSLENWIFDSYTLSNKIYSEVTKDDNLKYRYHYLNKDRTEQQLQKGGLRLSKVLNEIFK